MQRIKLKRKGKPSSHFAEIPSRGWLCQLYWYDGLDLEGIADLFIVSESTVSRWFSRYHIPRRTRGQGVQLKCANSAEYQNKILEHLRNRTGMPQKIKLGKGKIPCQKTLRLTE